MKFKTGNWYSISWSGLVGVSEYIEVLELGDGPWIRVQTYHSERDGDQFWMFQGGDAKWINTNHLASCQEYKRSELPKEWKPK